MRTRTRALTLTTALGALAATMVLASDAGAHCGKDHSRPSVHAGDRGHLGSRHRLQGRSLGGDRLGLRRDGGAGVSYDHGIGTLRGDGIGVYGRIQQPRAAGRGR